MTVTALGHIADSRTGNVSHRHALGLIVTAICYLGTLLLAHVGIVDRAAAAVVLILGVYLSLRPPSVVHPVTPVFLNYLIYVCMPYLLFLVYRVWSIEYILPWGLLNDWSRLSDTAIEHFELSFVLFYGLIHAFAQRDERDGAVDAVVGRGATGYEVKPGGVIGLSVALLIGAVAFFNHTGGFATWLSNYGDTYINKREGAGLLNYFLVNFAHVLAFTAGWMVWRSRRRYPRMLWLLIIVPLVFCTYLQGIKSRIPLLLFFFLMPRLSGVNVKVLKGALIFLFLIAFFMVAMYFRSDGFYATPRMGIEYLQSYFNTIFLHDIALSHFPQGEMNSMLMGMRKYTELVVGKLPREQYDLSVALTQQFYPKDWYEGGATQQWPIETDFYLTFPSPVFWVIPIGVYAFVLATVYRLSRKGSPVFMFIYAAEFVRMMTIFRSGLLTWDAILQVVLYAVVGVYLSWQVFQAPARETMALTPAPA